MKDKLCIDDYKGLKLVMNDTYPFNIEATKYFKGMQEEDVCVWCKNEK